MKIILGCAQFGIDYGVSNESGIVSSKRVLELINFAREKNIDTLDTARAYGSSEQKLGEVGIKDFKIITKLPKLPPNMKDIRSWIYQNIRTSCNYLDVSSIYGFLLHNPQDLLSKDSNNLVRALEEAQSDGIINKLGISIYSPDILDAVMKKMRLDIVQVPYNILDRRIETSGWLDRLIDNGVTIHTRSSFLQGLLLMKAIEIPRKFQRWQSLFKKWTSYLDNNNISAISACLSLPLSDKRISGVVLGVESQVQLKEIFDNYSTKLDHELLSLMSCNDLELIDPRRWDDLQ